MELLSQPLLLFFLLIFVVAGVLFIAHKMPKDQFMASVGKFKNKNGEFTLLEVGCKSTNQAEEEIAKALKVATHEISYQQIAIPQGFIILGLCRDGNFVKASLKAVINIPFEKDTKIILFVDQSDGQPRLGKTYSINDSVSVGISDDGETSRIIFGPASIHSLLAN